MSGAGELGSNPASRLLDRIAALLNAGDVDAVAALIAPDMERIDQRSTIAAPAATGADAFMETVRGWFEVGFRDFAVEHLDQRGDDLALVRTTWTAEHDAQVAFLAVYQDDGAGRLRRGANFDADDLDGASRMLTAWATQADDS